MSILEHAARLNRSTSKDVTNCNSKITRLRQSLYWPALYECGQSIRGVMQRSGSSSLTFQDLRHTFASRLREAGVDAIARRDLLGHSTVEMSDDYTHSSAESRLRAVESIADYRKQDYSNFTTNQDSETSVRIAS